MDPPEAPTESDCCNSGCNPCILDVYETQLKKYKESKHLQIPTINAITPTSYTKFKLTEKKQVSETAFLLKFVYCDSKDKIPNSFDYKPAQYILLRAKDTQGDFTRAYTPIPTENNPKLGFTIIVRIYEFGRMSRFLQRLEIGAVTTWRGPYGNIINCQAKYLFFIAQGTGIAPIFALINELVKDETCESFIKLYYCCRNSKDILLREQLYELGTYWNFSYEIFLGNSHNLVRKYTEIVHETKLGDSQIINYLNNKMGVVDVLICGSEGFSLFFLNKIEKLGIEKGHIYLF